MLHFDNFVFLSNHTLLPVEMCTFLGTFSRSRTLFGARHYLVPCPRSVPSFLCYRVLFCLCRWALHLALYLLVRYMHVHLRYVCEYITLDRHWPKPQPNLVPSALNSTDPPELARPA